AELGASHPGLMPQRTNERLSRPRVPNDSRRALSSFRRPVTVELSGPRSPNDSRSARRTGNHFLSIRTELGAVHPPVVPQWWRQFLPAHSVPNTGGLISTGCDDPLAVRTELRGRGASGAPVCVGRPSAIRSGPSFPGETRM